MTQLSFKASAIVLSAAVLAACATPTYSARAGYAAPPPLAPQYAISPTAPAAGPPSATPQPAPTAAAPAPPPAAGVPAPVESQPLPPAQAAPAQPSAAGTPPPPSGYQGAQPAYRPAAEQPRPAPSRLVADGKVVAAKGMFREYEVRRHDTLDEIARDLDTTREVLVESNHLKKPYALTPGRRLKIPIAKAYVAESGDTLAEVAQRFGVSAGELSDLNNLPARGRLSAGEKVALPASFRDHGPIRIAPQTYAQAPARTRRAYASAPTYSAPGRYSPAVQATGGPYVPSAAAVAAGARAREYAAQSAASPNPATPGAPAPSYRPPSFPSETPTARVDVAAAGKGRFIWPVRGEIISPFGAMGVGRRNDGIDIRSTQGTVVHAAAAGEVVYAGDQVPGFGNLVLVKHTDGWVTAYAHLDRVSVQMRQTIGQGQEIGQVGNTGGVPLPELHFEIRYAPTVSEKARPIDPLLVLPG